MANQAEQDIHAFSYNACASLAKAVVFRSLANQTLKRSERISATVSAYYSLLHLAITLIYLCSDKLNGSLHNKLRAERGQGEVDPSRLISHKSALEFVKACVRDGLDNRLYSQLEYAKHLREFVNYGPRLTISNDTPNFGPCNDRPNHCDSLVLVVSELFPLALEWAYKHSPLDGVIAKIAVDLCSKFFVQSDLFYAQWCSKECIEDSLEFIKDLKGKAHTGFQAAEVSSNESKEFKSSFPRFFILCTNSKKPK